MWRRWDKMAVGDAVADEVAASTAFQPASGVEICIGAIGSMTSASFWFLTDATNDATLHATASAVHGTKIFINNTDYIERDGTVAVGFYSGIQTK